MADKFGYTYTDPTDINEITGSTPYGYYDNDDAFVSESLSVCKFVSRRLGHPVMQLEMNSGSIYAMFEEAVSEYSQHINNYNIKNWMWDSYGSDTRVSGSGYGNSGSIEMMGTGSQQPSHGGMGTSIILSEKFKNKTFQEINKHTFL